MRRPALFAASGWYPKDEAQARLALADYLQGAPKPQAAKAVIAPHAGWRYSGPVAGRLYAELVVPKRVIALCPQHRPGGARLALWPSGAWQTPLGDVPVDAAFCRALAARVPAIENDPEAHLDEHSIEIQLPFLLARNPGFSLVPLRISDLSFADCEALALALAESITAAGGETLLLASSDMSHEPSLERVLANDALARERISAFDARGLYETVTAKAITMCGVLPAVVAWLAAGHLGAKAAKEVAYATSYDVSGRAEYVVGYSAARAE